MKNIIRAAILTTFALSLLGANASGQSQTREEVLREIEIKRAQLQKLEEQFLSPSQEDLSVHAEFLRQPDTGLIRLLPRETYDSEAYNHDKKVKKTVTMRGGGAYYSFSRLTHEYGFGSDIGLERGQLKAGFAGADYGMITNLGDVPFEEIAPEHPSLNFLADYKAPTEEPQARLESRRFSTGTAIDEAMYKSSLPVMVNNTYLLRSIVYGTSDVLVALRVVRQDSDGSIIITWRLLKKNPKPQFARNNPAQ